MRDDHGLETLLELNGTVAEQGGGYWVAIVAWRVPVTSDTPQGIRYSLTLHRPDGKRLLGYDNAHAVKTPRKYAIAGPRPPHDHKHRHSSDPGTPYAYSTAYRLLADFFEHVDAVLKEVGDS
jgi:hypothetical protein